MSYKNNEGYPDPTAGKAVRSAGRMPTHIYNTGKPLSSWNMLQEISLRSL